MRQRGNTCIEKQKDNENKEQRPSFPKETGKFNHLKKDYEGNLSCIA